MIKKKHIRRLSVLYTGFLAGMALCLTVLTGVESQAAKEGKVTTEMVNVRSEADQNSQRVGQLPAGTAFTVTEEATDSNGKVWYHAVFTSEGTQKTGWIRSDMAEITSQDEPESPAEPEEPTPSDAVIQGITLQEPEALPELSDIFMETQVTVGEMSYTGFALGGDWAGQEFYLVYGVDSNGSAGWYYYDGAQGTIQRDAGQFTAGNSQAETLLKALQAENEELIANQEKGMSVRNYIIMGLGAGCVLLLILVIVLAVKMSRIEYVDDEDEDDREDEDREEDEEEKEPIWMSAAKAKKEAERSRREKKQERKEEIEEEEAEAIEETEELEEELEEEEILAQVLKEEEEEDDFLDEELEDEQEEDLEDTFEKPAVKAKPAKHAKEKKEVKEGKKEKAAARAVEAAASKLHVSEDDYDDSDDFDIEIVDLDDLDL